MGWCELCWFLLYWLLIDLLGIVLHRLLVRLLLVLHLIKVILLLVGHVHLSSHAVALRNKLLESGMDTHWLLLELLLLHGCCHNPTGLDLEREHWDQIADLVVEKGLVPFIDLAYQGFANGLEEDTYGVRTPFLVGGGVALELGYSQMIWGRATSLGQSLLAGVSFTR